MKLTIKNDTVYPDPMRGAEQSIHNQTPDKEQQGLTKREYFAAMAISGLTVPAIVSGNIWQRIRQFFTGNNIKPLQLRGVEYDKIAQNVVRIADELVIALNSN